MNVDTSKFPKVFIYNDDVNENFMALDALLAKQQPFVMIRYRKDNIEQERGVKRDNAVHKRHAKWFKNNREKLAQWCAGGIFIVPNYILAKATEALSGSMEKSFKFPIKVLRDENDIDIWTTIFLEEYARLSKGKVK